MITSDECIVAVTRICCTSKSPICHKASCSNYRTPFFPVALTKEEVVLLDGTHNAVFGYLRCGPGRIVWSKGTTEVARYTWHDRFERYLRFPMLASDLVRYPVTKTFAVEATGVNVYDTALPQPWLDDFVRQVKLRATEITYDLVLSTTVWCYDIDRCFGRPVSCCTEVQDAINRIYQPVTEIPS